MANEPAQAPETPAQAPADSTPPPAESSQAPAESNPTGAATDPAAAPDPAQPATDSQGATPIPTTSPAAVLSGADHPPVKKEDVPATEKPSLIGKIKNIFKKKVSLIIVAVAIILILVGIFMIIRKTKQSAQAKTQKANTAQANSSPSTSSSPQEPSCISGYQAYTGKAFSLCYPISMSLKQQQATGSAAAKDYIFQDNVETLEVQTDYKDNLNKYACASNSVVTVSGFQAQRYTIKATTKSGTCDRTIASYGLIVSSGADKPVYYIGLSKKDGSSYQSDNGEFDIIQNSFQIN